MYRKDYPAQGVVELDALKSDTVDLTPDVRAIQIDGTSGAVKVTFVDDTVYTFSNLVVGMVYPYRIKRIWSTGTAATGVIGLL
jgi:hypothetical protein